MFIRLQVKATAVWQCDDDGVIRFPLEISTYNLLRSPSIHDQYLVLYVLPGSRSRWLIHDKKYTRILDSAYYLNLKDYPAVSNRCTKTVHVPVQNRLTAVKLRQLFVAEAAKWRSANA